MSKHILLALILTAQFAATACACDEVGYIKEARTPGAAITRPGVDSIPIHVTDEQSPSIQSVCEYDIITTPARVTVTYKTGQTTVKIHPETIVRIHHIVSHATFQDNMKARYIMDVLQGDIAVVNYDPTYHTVIQTPKALITGHGTSFTINNVQSLSRSQRRTGLLYASNQNEPGADSTPEICLYDGTVTVQSKFTDWKQIFYLWGCFLIGEANKLQDTIQRNLQITNSLFNEKSIQILLNSSQVTRRDLDFYLNLKDVPLLNDLEKFSKDNNGNPSFDYKFVILYENIQDAFKVDEEFAMHCVYEKGGATSDAILCDIDKMQNRTHVRLWANAAESPYGQITYAVEITMRNEP